MASTTRYRNVYVESPASINFRYLTLAGFTIQLTMRGEDVQALLEKVNGTLALLVDQGNLPIESSNGNNYNHDVKICQLHHAEMRRREKDGRYWHSHQLEDGSWCWGRPEQKEASS
jgi:hypothetical protein